MVRVIQPVDLNSGDFTNPQTGAAGEIAIRVDAASGVGAAIVAAVTPLAGAGAPSGAPAYPKLFYVDVSTTPNQHYWWNGSSWQLLGDGAGSGADGVLTGASLVGTTLTLTRSIGAPVTLNLAGLQDGTVTGASLAAGTLTLTRSVGAPITVNLSALQDGVITSLALVGTVLTANRSVGAALTVDLATLAGAAPDGVVTGAALAGTILTLTRSVGAPVAVDLAGLGGGGGADGVVTAASLAGTILTLTRSVGAPVTVDLASLAGGGGGSDGVITGASLDSTTGLLTLTRSVGADVTVSLAALLNVSADTLFDSVADATPFQIGNLTGAEQVWVELANGQLRQVAISDLPIGGGGGPIDITDLPVGSIVYAGYVQGGGGTDLAPGFTRTGAQIQYVYSIASGAAQISGGLVGTAAQTWTFLQTHVVAINGSVVAGNWIRTA